ncbi:unnamed protein product [Cylicocyclus nassatus]|uniref:Uncharacterized protein n=1 Tax=Cylicocyclus nassatus TaxID=53992 RepID=A0AA36GHA9_CYLNA|nr:unnamed protein product [Cylicocyclus nassatus]
MFCTIKKKASRNETVVLIHGGCLLAALGAALTCAVIKDFRIGMDYLVMRLSYYTAILWVPCTNIVTTFCVVASLRKHIKPNATITAAAGRKSTVVVIH